MIVYFLVMNSKRLFFKSNPNPRRQSCFAPRLVVPLGGPCLTSYFYDHFGFNNIKEVFRLKGRSRDHYNGNNKYVFNNKLFGFFSAMATGKSFIKTKVHMKVSLL